MLGEIKDTWPSVVYVPLVEHLTLPLELREPTRILRQFGAKQISTIMLLSGPIHTLSHSLCTSFSASCLQFIKLSIHPSSVGIDAGSVAGESR